MSAAHIERRWLIWSMATVTVTVVGFSVWAIGWPMWQEHRALEAFIVAFQKESSSGYDRQRKNNPPPPGTLCLTGKESEFDKAVAKIKAIRGGGFAVPWLIERLRSDDSV